MKNIQIIDGATNSVFEIYSISEEVFQILFPDGRDIAFEKDFDPKDTRLHSLYEWRVDKKQVVGIHGTLHLAGSVASSEDIVSRRESDL